ncbi:hypothetical protein [Stenotrophomonas geniculata]
MSLNANSLLNLHINKAVVSAFFENDFQQMIERLKSQPLDGRREYDVMTHHAGLFFALHSERYSLDEFMIRWEQDDVSTTVCARTYLVTLSCKGSVFDEFYLNDEAFVVLVEMERLRRYFLNS